MACLPADPGVEQCTIRRVELSCPSGSQSIRIISLVRMIPVALPSVETLLLLAFLLATTLVWGIWTMVLIARYAGGRWGRPMMLPYGLATAIAILHFGSSVISISRCVPMTGNGV